MQNERLSHAYRVSKHSSDPKGQFRCSDFHAAATERATAQAFLYRVATQKMRWLCRVAGRRVSARCDGVGSKIPHGRSVSHVLVMAAIACRVSLSNPVEPRKLGRWENDGECAECGRRTSVRAWTIFQDTRVPLPIWFRAMWLVSALKNGTSALGLQRNTSRTWTTLHKLRRAMVRPGRDLLIGRVKVDQCYLGGAGRGVARSPQSGEGFSGRGRTTHKKVDRGLAGFVCATLWMPSRPARLCGSRWQRGQRDSYRWLAGIFAFGEPGL